MWRAAGARWITKERRSTSSRSADATKRSALKLMRKLLKKQGFAPTVIETKKLLPYPAAFAERGLAPTMSEA